MKTRSAHGASNGRTPGLCRSPWWAACAGSVLVAAASYGGVSNAETAVVQVIDSDRQPVADAAVYLTPTGATTPALRDGTVTSAIMDQIGYQFVPRVLVVRTGTEVAFPNSDNVLHHVYSFSEAKRFELPLYAGTSHAPVLFDRPGLVTLGCNIHDDMVGYILVVNTPYFGKTDATGRLVLEGLPPGPYEVAAWSSRQRDTNTIQHEPFVLAASRADAPLTLALAGRLRPPPPDRHVGALWQAY